MQLLEGTGQLLGPFSSGGSERWQWVYDSSYFKIQRPILIKGLALRSDARLALAPFQFPSVQVVMASATADFSSLNTSNLDANLGSDALVVRNPLPFTGAGSPGTNCEPTVFHELVLGQSFFYNPALGQDLVIDIRVCTPTIPWSVPVDAVGGTLGTALGNTASCAGGSVTSTPSVCPVVRVQYLTTPQWQLNDFPTAGLNIENRPQDPFGPLLVETTAGVPGFITVTSNLVGQGWEFILTPFPGVSAAQGALTTPGGQLVNIDLSAGGIFLFNNLSFPPWISTFSLPYNFPIAVPALGAQFQIFDPSHPDNSRLSALAQFAVASSTSISATPVAGPAANDTSVAVPVGNFQFLGKIYTQVQVSDNGRVVFGLVPDDTPAGLSQYDYCEQPAFAGYWADLDPSLGGSITIGRESGSSFKLRVQYTNVPYAGFPASQNTFAIILDGTTGAVSLTGLSGIAPHPAPAPTAAHNAWVGVSPGRGNSTDHGSVTYGVGGPFAPPTRTAATYQYGLSGTFPAGVNTIRFTKSAAPNNSGNLNWTGL